MLVDVAGLSDSGGGGSARQRGWWVGVAAEVVGRHGSGPGLEGQRGWCVGEERGPRIGDFSPIPSRARG
jgi:hypothetical protein